MRRLLLLLALAVPAASLAGSGTHVPKRGRPQAAKTQGRAKGRAMELRSFANRWAGTSYRWGGSSKLGIDCSAYARQMFREVFQVELPRTTRQQISLGVRVDLDTHQLGAGFQPGDLFFYVDRTGVPNHVVVYMGDGMFTHSASGRGVVIEGFRALWGRRIVGRRVLVPAKDGAVASGDYGPIPAAGPLEEPLEIPCPPSVRAKREHIRRYRLEPISNMAETELEGICEWRALRDALQKRGGPAVDQSVERIDQHLEWIESIEFLKGEIDRSR